MVGSMCILLDRDLGAAWNINKERGHAHVRAACHRRRAAVRSLKLSRAGEGEIGKAGQRGSACILTSQPRHALGPTQPGCLPGTSVAAVGVLVTGPEYLPDGGEFYLVQRRKG